MMMNSLSTCNLNKKLYNWQTPDFKLYKHIGPRAYRVTLCIVNLKFGEMEFGEMKHVELEQFLHASASCGFVSVSWTFLFVAGHVCVCVLD